MTRARPSTVVNFGRKDLLSVHLDLTRLLRGVMTGEATAIPSLPK
jgi:hypothetical protein